MLKNNHFKAKPDPRQNLSGKIFISGNSPYNVGSKYVLFEKPDNRTKNRIPGSGTCKFA